MSKASLIGGLPEPVVYGDDGGVDISFVGRRIENVMLDIIDIMSAKGVK